MSMTSKFMSRRAVLGGALAAAAIPLTARGQEGRDPANQEPTDVRIRIGFNNLTLTATLFDNPTARDLVSMLPLNLTIEDYGRNEKIVHLPRKLTEEGSGAFGNEQPGDLCYFKPWGNLGLPLGRADPARPLRQWLRAVAGARRVFGPHRTHLTRALWP